MQLTSMIPQNLSHMHWVELESPHAVGFTSDEQIEHYKQWKNAAIEEVKIVSQRNASKVADTIEELIVELKSRYNINVIEAYLRHSHPFKLGALLLVDEDAFLSEDFRNAYKLSRNYVEKISEDILQFEISYASKSENIDEDDIYCDGYTLKRATVNE